MLKTKMYTVDLDLFIYLRKFYLNNNTICFRQIDMYYVHCMYSAFDIYSDFSVVTKDCKHHETLRLILE